MEFWDSMHHVTLQNGFQLFVTLKVVGVTGRTLGHVLLPVELVYRGRPGGVSVLLQVITVNGAKEKMKMTYYAM